MKRIKQYPSNQFEKVESIRFLASIVETPALSQEAKDKASKLIDRIVDEMVEQVDEDIDEDRRRIKLL